MTMNDDCRTAAGMSGSWEDYAKVTRSALALLQVDLPQCLPGEPLDCGHDFAQHALGNLAALKAWAEVELQHFHHDDEHGQNTAEQLLTYWRTQFSADHPCQHGEAGR
ncbi:hypothetical protein ACWGLK_31570 [Streptomyces albidoflavus]|uniref:hypothetical protein n=1 Tax=Streptomyces sp. NPDC056144 TaxID=3345726 RepID=UPI0035D86930